MVDYDRNRTPQYGRSLPQEHEYAESKCRANPENCAMLRRLAPRGSTVYYQVVSVSSSGMSRNIRIFVVADGKIQDISGMVRSFVGLSKPRSGQYDYAIRMGGTGMDMGYAVVINLSSALYGDSYALHAQRL